eukprot:TRINITY_DN11443_c0_g1_i5.p1 TRINITY_DN11443_c0_g1~~TRINITY_DN11443_c0_g1_i5.p1  ORF type:complete len:442 (-),score=97.20 TRINITY_DN11443_c0_g1_i5:53-1237(-)
MLGKSPSFEQMGAAASHMNMGEFLKFCRDFMVPIKTSRLKLLFIKYGTSRVGVDIDAFVALLQEMAFMVVEEKIEGMQVNLDKVIGELIFLENSPEVFDEQLHKQLLSEKLHYEKEIYYLEQKDDNEVLLDFYCFLECDDPANYKRKMKSISLPFNTKDKSTRIPPSSCPRSYKKKTRNDIQRMVDKIKHDRVQKELEAKKSLKDKRARGISRPRKLSRQTFATGDTPYGKQLAPKKENASVKEFQSAHNITWDLLNAIKYKDILPSNDPEFKPTDFISNFNQIQPPPLVNINTASAHSRQEPSEYNFSVTSNSLKQIDEGITAHKPLNEKHYQGSSGRVKDRSSIGQCTMDRANQIESEEKSQEAMVCICGMGRSTTGYCNCMTRRCSEEDYI